METWTQIGMKEATLGYDIFFPSLMACRLILSTWGAVKSHVTYTHMDGMPDFEGLSTAGQIMPVFEPQALASSTHSYDI